MILSMYIFVNNQRCWQPAIDHVNLPSGLQSELGPMELEKASELDLL